MTATYWLVVGFIGQALFGMRFVIQWIISEKRGESIPAFLVRQD